MRRIGCFFINFKWNLRMPVKIELERDLVVLRISGLLAQPAIEDMQKQCEDLIGKLGYLKMLVLTGEEFSGWNRDNAWIGAFRGDLYKGKIAIVGKPEFREIVYSFAGTGLRSVAVRYFSTDQESDARKWLNIP